MSTYQPLESSNNDPKILPPVSPLIQVNSTQVTNITSISRGLINPINPNDHQSKNIRTTLTGQAIRNNKFDFATGKFDQGYPFNDIYYFCNQNLSSIAHYGKFSFARSYYLGQPKSYIVISPQYNNLIACNSTSPLPSGSPSTIFNIPTNPPQQPFPNKQPGPTNCSTICAPGDTLDSVSCSCVTQEMCIPQSNCPTPEPIATDLKPMIYGYAYYATDYRTVNIPEVGEIGITCYGGHICCNTIFHPIIKTSNNTIIKANKTITLNNASYTIDCISNNIISDPNFIPANELERSDTFYFMVDDPNVLLDSQLYLECKLPYCHTGITMIVLVGERLSGEKVLLFSSCVTPNEINAKSIGTIDCEDAEPIPCSQLTQPTPTVPPEECIPLSETSSLNISVPGFNWDPTITNDPFYNFVNNIMTDTYSLTYSFNEDDEINTSHQFTFDWGGNPVILNIVLYSSLQDNEIYIEYAITQPSAISIPGGLWVAISTGYVNDNDLEQCSLSIDGATSGGIGIGNATVGPVILSTN